MTIFFFISSNDHLEKYGAISIKNYTRWTYSSKNDVNTRRPYELRYLPYTANSSHS